MLEINNDISDFCETFGIKYKFFSIINCLVYEYLVSKLKFDVKSSINTSFGIYVFNRSEKELEDLYCRYNEFKAFK